jgi:hypothetical protein
MKILDFIYYLVIIALLAFYIEISNAPKSMTCITTAPDVQTCVVTNLLGK